MAESERTLVRPSAMTTWLASLRSLLTSVLRFARSSALGAAAVGLLTALAAVAIFADLLAPYDPLKLNFAFIRQPPSGDFYLGTDFIGRDLLSRIIFGSRITLMVAGTAIAAGGTLGFVWGVVTGYFGGRFDLISQRVLDVLMAFPTVILALLLLAAIGAGLDTVILAIAVVSVPNFTRVIRSVALSVREMSYVDAAHAMGVSPARIMARHVAPQCIAPLLVVVSAALGGAIFAEAALSFLGMGIPPPTPTWGNMLGGVLSDLYKPPWWLVIFPGVAITMTVLAFNLLGDALRDYLDPRLRGRLE
ncbi:MAG: ABC transporter permease [SAR202 cluster bacterium]|nr:ABC transporter permease [SAR202 cluster bacterium]